MALIELCAGEVGIWQPVALLLHDQAGLHQVDVASGVVGVVVHREGRMEVHGG